MSTSVIPAARQQKIWRLRKYDEGLVNEIKERKGLRLATAKALVASGCESLEAANNFLEPRFDAWFELDGFESLKQGVAILYERIQAGKKVCIHGDFDTDGVTAAVIMRECFRALKQECLCYIPGREEGHGITVESVRKIKELGGDVIVTVDCGITANEAVAEAVSLGMEVVITDHHLADETLPDAIAIINPQLGDEERYKIYSGAGISLRVCMQLAESYPAHLRGSDDFKSYIRHAIVLAAIATIGDIVPLVGDNRALVSQALKMLDGLEWPCLAELLKASKLRQNITAEDLAFQLIPMLNAAQRMERGELVRELFDCQDSQRAGEICRQLADLNGQRKAHQLEMTNLVMNELPRPVEDAAIVIDGCAWKEGVSGLIASKVVETFHRPCAVILCKEGKGYASCRAPKGYSLKSALDECSEYLLEYGGHAGAAGFRLAEEQLPKFRELFVQSIARQFESNDEARSAEKLLICCELQWPDIQMEFMQELSRLEPFGHDNPKPLFACKNVYIDGSPHYIGSDGQHVILKLYRPGHPAIKAIGFNFSDEVSALGGTRQVDIAFHMGYERGNRRLQLFLQAIRPN